MSKVQSTGRGSMLRALQAGIIALVAAVEVCAGYAQTNLFAPLSTKSAADIAPAKEDGILRQRFTAINAAAVADAATTDTDENLQLEFFPDARYLITLDKKISAAGPRNFVRTGRVAGKPLATFHISVVNEATAVDLRLPDGITYSVRYRGDGTHEIKEITEAAQGTCGTTGTLKPPVMAPDNNSSAIKIPGGGDPAGEIDVLVAYTTEAQIAAGGYAGIQSQINLAFAHANTSYVNSQIPLTLYKVGTVEVSYTPDSSNMPNDLSRLAAKNDGYMDEIHALRDSYAADMVCLLVGSVANNACGYGYIMDSVGSGFEQYCFSVCAITCINNQTFAHELGHNMGCAHDSANAGTKAYPYSLGWRWYGLGGTQYRSVMAYAPGNRVQYFSNPDVNYDGVATGVSNSADNARTIRNTAFTVANFRQRGTAPTEPELVVAPNPVSVDAILGSDATATIGVGNAGAGSISYSISENATWATISPLSGTAVGQSTFNQHTLALDIDSLSAGHYTASVTVTETGSTNSPTVVPIDLTIISGPANDNVANAETLNGVTGTVTGSNQLATREASEPTIPSHSHNKSIWYKWTAPGTGQATFDTIGSSFDTILGIYTGPAGALSLVTHNDDGTNIGTRSRVAFTQTPGTTYFIQVDGYNSASGNVTLNWTGGAAVSEWEEY